MGPGFFTFDAHGARLRSGLASETEPGDREHEHAEQADDKP